MGAISRRSIRTKAPLTAVVLILLVVATLSTASLVVLRRTLHSNASQRLRTLAAQLGETFRANAATSRARAVAAAKRPEIAGYLENPSIDREAAARKAMLYSGPQPELSLKTELRDRAGRVLLTSLPVDSAGFTTTDADVGDWMAVSAAALAAPDALIFSKLRQNGDVIFYSMVSAVPHEPNAFLIHWRRLSNSQLARTQLAKTLGSDAAFFVGNADNTVWSELGRPAQPPSHSANGSVFEFDRPGSGTMIAIRAPIEGSPWAYSLEFPAQVIEAPARTFLWTMSSIAAACLLVGGFAAWWISRRIAAPIEMLTGAADAIARGQTPHRVNLGREDELGRLGAAFNAMAAEVELARRHLEEVVATRTNELRVAQESLVRREKLAVIGHLASGVGHEIRNPLGVMANAVYYLEHIQPDAPPEVRQYLAILRQQIQLSSKIVNDLLDLSRTRPAHRERIGIDGLLDERLRGRMNGTLETDIPADLPHVMVDPVHAGQVLDNLLTNALQAINGSGKVRVSARATGDGFVRVEVSDNGPGISSDNFSRIFEPLFTTKARGIGLGLALSKSLAQANGGDLALVSLPDQSATFAFTLPAAHGTA